MVDDGDQIIQLILMRLQCRFPDRAFVALAVAQHAVHAPIGVVLLAAQRHACRHAQPVTQRTGGKLHTRHALVAHMPGQARAVGVMGGKLLHREKAALRQCRIHRRARMALGENQPIAIFPLRILRVNAQDAGVEHRHNLRD